MVENVIIILCLLAIGGSILWYLIRAKKRGDKCVGCPHAKQCGGHCGGGAPQNPQAPKK